MRFWGFFRDFIERGRFVKSLNATFLALVPKKGGAEDLIGRLALWATSISY